MNYSEELEIGDESERLEETKAKLTGSKPLSLK